MSTHMKVRASGIVFLILALLASLLPLAHPVLAVDVLAIEKINNLYQWANGTPTKDPKWQHGNINANNSVYYESDSVPYYTHLSGLNVNDIYYITIEWDTTKGGKHAIDYITTYDRSYTPENPCTHAGLAIDLSPDTEPIPLDSNIPTDPDWGGTQEAGDFTIFHGTFTDATGDASGDATSGYTLSGSYTGDSSTSITLYFRADAADLVIGWGGHIAAQSDWGSGNSAVAISGSPYHMRILDLYNVSQDNQLNVGNMDRSMSAATVMQTPIISIVKTVDPTIVSSPQSVTYTYQVTNEGNVSLTGVTVTDDNGTPGDTGDDFSPTYVSGDDGDGELDAGETWIYTASRDITQGDIDAGSPITNTATADSDETDPATDDAVVTFYNWPCEGEIKIEKMDPSNNLLGGAEFEIAPDPTTGTGTLTVSDGDNDGIITVSNVPPGSYTITETTAPSGYDADPNPQTEVVACNETTTYTFTNTPCYGEIGDFVWADTDEDGVQDINEDGIPNITLTLYNASDRSVIATAETDANGYYLFSDLEAGNYIVDVDENDDDMTTDYFSTTRNDPMTILLATCEDFLDADFGYHFYTGELGIIGDYVWVDSNSDGVQDPWEEGLPFVTVILYADDGTYLRETETDFYGNYYFYDCEDGTYRVELDINDPDLEDYIPTTTTLVIAVIDSNFLDADFGLARGASKSGIKFHDLDGDGIKDQDEPGLSSWTIYVDYNDNSTHDAATEPSAVTAADGSYTITGIKPGQAKVREVVKGGWNQSYPASGYHDETFESGESYTGNDFGNYRPTGNLIIYKYNDEQGDGEYNGDETLLDGWTFKATGPVMVSGITSGGIVIFNNLPVGTYLVKETLKSGWYNTDPDGPWYGKAVQVIADQTTEVYFGNVQMGSLRIFKYNDLLGDGQFNGADYGLRSWHFRVSGKPGDFVTDASGYVTITNLAPGPHNVSEVLPIPPYWVCTDPGPSRQKDVVIIPGATGEVIFGNQEQAHLVSSLNEWGIAGLSVALAGLLFWFGVRRRRTAPQR